MLESQRLAPLQAAELLQQGTNDPSADPTGLLQAQSELDKREIILKRVADVTPGVIEVVDLDKASTLFANRCIAALLGYSPGQVASMGPGLVPALMHPDDAPRLAAHRQRLRSLVDHEVADIEYRLRERSGSWRWFRNRDAVFARDAAGAVSQIIGHAVDISERKETEEKTRHHEEVCRLTFDLCPAGMVSADINLHIIRANPVFCKITGYTADELLRMKVSDLTHPDDLAASKTQMDLLHAGVAEQGDMEKRYIRKDGAICWVHVTMRMVRNATGQPLHSVGVVVDINERRQTQQALRESGAFSQSLLPSRPDCVKVLDGEWRLQHTNSNGQCLTEVDDVAERLVSVSRNITDTTDNTLAQQALREQQERYRSLFDSMLEGYCLVDMLFDTTGRPCDYRFVETNPAFEVHTGLKDAKGRLISELLPGIEPFWVEAFGTVALSGEPQHFQSESQLLRRLFDVKAHRIGGPESRKVGIVFSDISERQHAEIAVVQNAVLFSTLLEQAPTGMYVVDAGFRLQQVNALALPIFKTIEPLIGRDFAEIMEILWGPIVGAQCTAIFRHTLASGERYVSPPFYERRFDVGEDQAFDWETQRITLPNGQHGVVCYFHEITARQRAEMALRDSEERMRLATEATGVGVWEWNLNTGVVRWDAQMFRIYGIAPTADGCVQYTDWSSSVHPEDLDTQEETLRDAVRRLGSSSLDFRIQRRNDGKYRHIYAAETVRKSAGGQAEWMVGTNLDVTERKLAEERIRTLLEELRLADSRKDEFLATLAHELRNPLAAIRNSLELVKRGSGNAGLMARACSTMERQMAQMVHLIDDLLDISRITRDRLELRLERVELASVVQHVVQACRPLCEQAGHQLHVTLPPEPITLNADPMRLAQVFGNLLNNASKYTPRGGHIWLSAERQGQQVALTVKDSGVGIAPDMLQKVFELFTQVGSSLEHSQGGLGIGLSLAKRLTELHGGTLTAHSEGTDQGSAFVVNLPVPLPVLLPVPLAPPRPAAPVPIADPAPATAGRRILVVDDLRESADSLALLLSMGGHETQVAYDGVEAVKSAEAFRPDVILLDIGMPKMNGYDACRAIRQQPWGKSILMIALTGWGQEGDRRLSTAADFDHHLVKPVDYEDVIKLLAVPHKALPPGGDKGLV